MNPRAPLAALLLAFASAAPSAAFAADPPQSFGRPEFSRTPPPTTTPLRPQPIAPMGIGLSVVGAAALIGSGIAFIASPYGEERCGLTGCFHQSSTGLNTAAGTLLGAGLGAGLLGGSIWAHGARKDATATDLRRSEGVTRAGIILTSIGVMGTGAGIGMIAGRNLSANPRDVYIAEPLGYTMIGLSTAFVAAGIPIWASGARTPKDDELSAQSPNATTGTPPAGEPGRYSTGMMVTGIVLTSTGGAALLGGFASIAGSDSIGGIVVGIMCLGGGGILTATGIPLWIVGARTVYPSQAALPSALSSPWVPSLRLSPTYAELRWEL